MTRPLGRLRLGERYPEHTSSVHEVGAAVRTWDGYLVRVIDKHETHAFGSWKYVYTMEVIELSRRYREG